jgi:hypothetical protein
MLSFASEGSVRRGLLGRWQTKAGTSLLLVYLSFVCCREVRGVVHTIYPQERREFVPRGEPQ